MTKNLFCTAYTTDGKKILHHCKILHFVQDDTSIYIAIMEKDDCHNCHSEEQ